MIDFLFPKFCLFCSVKGCYICQSCLFSYAQFSYTQVCHVCGGECRSGFIHRDCQSLSFLDGLLYVCKYNKFSKKIIREAKYKFVKEVLMDVAKIMSEYSERFIIIPDIITSVPLHIQKQSRRGFNQAEVMAQKFSNLKGSFYKTLLIRNKSTKTQVGMDKSQRSENLKGVFSIKEDQKENILGKNILIIDDVFTTGTTLNEIAKVLKEAGANLVFGYTFAKRG